MKHSTLEKRNPYAMLSSALLEGWEAVDSIPVAGDGEFVVLTISGLIRTARNRNAVRKHRRADSCECGAVRYIVSGDPIVIYACHCTICQSQSGSAFGLAMRIHADDFQASVGELKSFQRIAESGQVFTNSFCPECGTRIHHQASKATNHLSLKPGTLDDTSWLKPTHHVFARSAQPWFIFPGDAQVFETVPFDRSWLAGET